MAYGTRCTRCGWQECDHGPGDCEEDDPDTVKPGFDITLTDCKGFISDNPDAEYDMARDEFGFNSLEDIDALTGCDDFRLADSTGGLAIRLKKTFRARRKKERASKRIEG